MVGVMKDFEYYSSRDFVEINIEYSVMVYGGELKACRNLLDGMLLACVVIS